MRGRIVFIVVSVLLLLVFTLLLPLDRLSDWSRHHPVQVFADTPTPPNGMAHPTTLVPALMVAAPTISRGVPPAVPPDVVLGATSFIDPARKAMPLFPPCVTPQRLLEASRHNGSAHANCLAAFSGRILIDRDAGLFSSHGVDAQGPITVAKRDMRRPTMCTVGKNMYLRVPPIASMPSRASSSSSSSSASCRAVGAVAYVGLVERPHHAFQFLYSLIGHIVAVQEIAATQRRQAADDGGCGATGQGPAPARGIAIHLAVLTYGQFHAYTDIFDTKRWPHMELLGLLPWIAAHAHDKSSDPSSVPPVPVPPLSEYVRNISFFRDAVHFGKATVAVPPDTAGPHSHCPVVEYPHAYYGGFALKLVGVGDYHKARAVPFVGRDQITAIRALLIRAMGLHEERDPARRSVLVVSRRRQRRRLILNEEALVNVTAAALALPQGVQGVRVVDWEGMPLREQLQLAVNTNVIVGMHGNGLCWACFMPTGALMVEVSSNVHLKNEVRGGINVKNVGNLAGTICPITSFSVLAEAVDNAFSAKTSPGHRWKEVDVRLSLAQLGEVGEFLSKYRDDVRRLRTAK